MNVEIEEKGLAKIYLDISKGEQERLFLMQLNFVLLFFFNIKTLLSYSAEYNKLVSDFHKDKNFLYDHNTGYFNKYTTVADSAEIIIGG